MAKITPQEPTDDMREKMFAQDARLGAFPGFTERQLRQESQFDPFARSDAGAVGYAQVTPKTLGVIEQRAGRKLDPSNFDDSLDIHYAVMSENLRKFGDLEDATRAYNSGWDPAKWDNPETNKYHATIFGGMAGSPRVADPSAVVLAQAGAGGVPAKPDHVTEALDRRARMDSTITGYAQTAVAAPATPTGEAPMFYEQAAEEQGGAEMAATTHDATMQEALRDAWNNSNLTGLSLAAIMSPQADPNFAVSDEQRKAVREQAAQVYANKDLRDYVFGASSKEDFSDRLVQARDRAEFQTRAANNEGWGAFGQFASGMAGGLADPVMLVGTMGLGAAVGTMRATSAAARGLMASRVARAAEGALAAGVENAGIEAIVRKANNQDITFNGVMQQGLFGAALGAAGGMLAKAPHEMHPAERGATNTVMENTERAVQEPVMGAPHGDAANEGTIPTGVNDHPATNPMATAPDQPYLTAVRDYERMAAGEPRQVASAEAAANEVDPIHTEQRQLASVRNEEALVAGEPSKVGDLRRKPANDPAATGAPELRVIKGGKEEVAATDAPVPDQHFSPDGKHIGLKTDDLMTDPGRAEGSLRAELTKMMSHADPSISVVAGRFLEALKGLDVGIRRLDLPEASRGKYRTADNTIELNTSPRNSESHASDEHVLLHEAAHALAAHKIQYGLKNPESAHGKIVSEIEAIRKRAQSEYLGDERQSRYYMRDAHEFVSGLFSGKSEFIEHLAKMQWGEGQSFLGKLFNAVRKLLGFDAPENSALARALQLSDRLMDTDLRVTVNGMEGPTYSIFRFDDPAEKLAANDATQKWSQAIADHVEVQGPAAKRAAAYYEREAGKVLGGVRAVLEGTGASKLLDSVGNMMARSKSKGVRMVASMLAEDPSGVNRQHADSAALDAVRLKNAWRETFTEAYANIVPQLLSGKELAAYRGGVSRDAERRIGRQVAEYRLAVRNARLLETELDKSAFDPRIRALAGHLDGFWKNIHEDGKKAGHEQATAIGGKGWQGYMPYRWDWAKIHSDFTAAPEKFNTLHALFRNEYAAKIIDPAVSNALKKGATAEDIIALRDTLSQKVDHLTGNYIKQVMRDPKSRIQHADNHVSEIAQQLLDDEFRGSKVTGELVAEFKKRLTEIKDDRTRTEFDLLRSQNGVSMLDYVDTDIGRMVDNASTRYSGEMALSRRGLGDVTAIDGMKEALVRDGATPEDISNIQFLVDSLTGKLSPDQVGAAKVMQDAAYASMMGKLGFNALADASGAITAVGVRGMFKMLGQAFGKEPAILESLRSFSPGVIVHDPYLFTQTADGAANPAHIFAEGSQLVNSAAKGTRAVSVLSGMKFISERLHKGFIPVFANELIGTVLRGEGMSAARLGDLGLTAERLAKIREQLTTHDAGWKSGDAVSWAKWDAGVADDFIAVIQRGTGQALQRSYLGETPRWMAETMAGRLIGQFRRFGFLAAEKQSVRNAAIGDSNSASGFVVSTAMGAALYYAKMYANTVGMSDSQRDKYLEKAFTGWQAAAGMMTMINMTGMAADAADAGNLMLNGRTYGSSSAIAAMGFWTNFATGTAALSSAAAGTVMGDEVDYQKTMRNTMRMVPGANTVFGTTLSNALHNGE